MTRPTDAAIARAFYSAVAVIKPEHIEGVQSFVSAVIAKAAEFDAESPAGTDPYMHIIPEKVTTSPERVQIPAESTHVQCPKCPAHMPVGLYCGGPNCPLRK